MNELTDLEICKRLAEIEGYKKTGTVWGECVIVSNEDDTTSFNPLTDDALCFKLMIKYKVSLTYGEYAVNAEILIEKEDGDYSFSSQTYCPKRAICLAIIKPKE
jgi:hypothetical protein